MAAEWEKHAIQPKYNGVDYLKHLKELLPIGPIWEFIVGGGLLLSNILQDLASLTGLNVLQDNITTGAFDTIQDTASRTTDGEQFAGSLFGRILSCFAEELARVSADVTQLYNESVPGLSTQMLEDWERVLGTRTGCAADLEYTLAERRELVHKKFFGEYTTATVAYLESLAEPLGFTVTITELSRYGSSCVCGVARTGANRVGGQGAYSVLTITVHAGGSGDEDQLQCVINKHKPAHTTAVWVFL